MPRPSDVVTLGPAEKCFDSSASIDRFRIIYDHKGRFVLHPISAQEASFKLCKIMRQQVAARPRPAQGAPWRTHASRQLLPAHPIARSHVCVGAAEHAPLSTCRVSPLHVPFPRIAPVPRRS